MSVIVQLRRDTAANIAAATPAQGEVWVNTTANRLVVGDGTTPGGIPVAKLSEVSGAVGPNGSALSLALVEITVPGLSGTSVTVSAAIPAGAIVVACAARVITTITGASSFSLGYTGSTSAFGSGIGTGVGTTAEGAIVPAPFASATNVILTSSGGSFSGGAVRLSVQYLSVTPPTS